MPSSRLKKLLSKPSSSSSSKRSESLSSSNHSLHSNPTSSGSILISAANPTTSSSSLSSISEEAARRRLRHYHRARGSTDNDAVGNSIQTTTLDEDEIMDSLFVSSRRHPRGTTAVLDGREMEMLVKIMARAQEANNVALLDLNSSIRALTDRLESIEEEKGIRSDNNNGCDGDSPVTAAALPPPQASGAATRSTSCVLPRQSSDSTNDVEDDFVLDRRKMFAQMHVRQTKQKNAKPIQQQIQRHNNKDMKQQEKSSKDDANEEEEEVVEIDVDRVSIRLDGVEVYAVVSAITLATAVSSFEIINVSQWSTHAANRDYYHMLIIILNLVSGSVGIVSGLHSVIIFSLTTMYGRTAVGLSHDDAYDEFFAKTALQRVRGFRMFLLSMYAFMVQVVILIESRCPGVFKPVMVVLAWWLLKIVHVDTQGVIRGAECIFQPREERKSSGSSGSSKEKRRRLTVGGAAMHGTSRSVLIPSSRKLKASFSDEDEKKEG